jgi:Flp pilus assembly pilin Flp
LASIASVTVQPASAPAESSSFVPTRTRIDSDDRTDKRQHAICKSLARATRPESDVNEFSRDESGVTVLEYVANAAFASLVLFGPLHTIFTSMRTKVNGFAGQL